ncbi:MAG: nucleoside hydrolase, partial [Turicibacter sp.]
WDAITQGAFITDDEVAYLKNSGSNLATFALRCTKSLYEFNKRIGNDGFDLADPTAMLVALYPDILTKKIDAFTRVEFKDEEHYGHVLLDETKLPNATICTEIDSDLFKKYLFEMLMAD